MFVEFSYQYHHIFESILALRKQYFLSRRAMAELIGISERTLKGLEEQTCEPVLPLSALNRLEKVFELDINDLIDYPLEQFLPYMEPKPSPQRRHLLHISACDAEAPCK